MIEHPTFTDFYVALHGRKPFPWQARLADQLGGGDPWPGEIGVPTGLGKTTCLDIAVWWIASQADRPASERSTPTRIWWLVNRRLLVDATTDHAELLEAQLAAATGVDAVGAVAARLRQLSADPHAAPLQVVRLRGGAASGRPVDPSQPAVVLSTLPMYGSRLLFRGYGSSRSMRPIDAALAGTDSLVLVDEAHLAHHLMRLFDPLSDCARPEVQILPDGRQRPTVVSLTATGSSDDASRFDLDPADHANDTVRQRLEARKPVRIVELPPKSSTAKPLAAAAAELLAERGRPASCVVFVNTPAVARAAAGELEKLVRPADLDLVVLTGRQRDRESRAARDRILDMMRGAPSARPLRDRDRHLVVVATQTLEVGADVDFEYCVTEACGVRALTQRLGRVNRLGRFGHAAAVYLHAEPPARGVAEPSWPVYGTEPLAVLERLRAHATDGAVDLGPVSVAGVLGPPGDDPGRAPEVLPAILWEWVKTTCPPAGEAPVEPYFSGLAEPVRRVSVCWRAHVPGAVDAGQPAEDGGQQRVWPRVREAEVVDLPIDEIRTAFEEEDVIARLGADRTSVEHVRPADLRPGDTVVLPLDAGRLDVHGWNPDASELVVDASLGDRGLPLDAGALERLIEPVPRRALAALFDNEDPDLTHELLGALHAELADASPRALPEGEWNELVAALDLDRGVVTVRGEVPRLVVRGGVREARVDALDELSASYPQVVELDEHGIGVERRARAVGQKLGLVGLLGESVSRSARFHDTGKADPRFQRWLDPNAASLVPLAKSTTPTARWAATRISSGWPEGGRHEELSGRLVTEWLRNSRMDASQLDCDLLVHLVVSHHGHARPFLRPVDADGAHQLTGNLAGDEVTIDADLSRPDWEQPDRFWRLNERYGPWGLALLEAVVRQSDHAVSGGAWAGASEEVL